MRFAIAYSKLDTAGINIVEQLKQMSFLPQIPIIELKKETIYSENIDKDSRLKNIDFIIFASRHASKEARKTLSLHAPGNFRNADFGGKSGKVCSTSAFILKYLFQQLNKNTEIEKLTNYQITLECTHHGPLIEIPCCFIEIGSTINQWQDEKAGKIIAKTILSLQNYKENKDWIPCIGIGGLHYMQSFNKIQLNSRYAIGHAIPKYVFPLTENMLNQAEQKTIEQIKTILLDWKGCGNSEERQKIFNITKKSGIEVKRTSEISRETKINIK